MGIVVSHVLPSLTLFIFCSVDIPGMGQGPFTHEEKCGRSISLSLSLRSSLVR